MKRRVRMTVAYDGAPFHGFAAHSGVRTVMGDLRSALQRVTQTDLELTGAGRTDAGVHGWGQVVSGDVDDDVDLADLRRRVNRMCAPAIVIRDIAWADAEFNARFSATWRHYRYDITNGDVQPPALALSAWHVAAPLNLHAMRLGADPLIGEHDFASFCRRPKVAGGQPLPSLVRRVMLARWSQVETDYHPLLRFEIRANAFCQQMVRSIVGTLVDVGLGRISAGDVSAILRTGDRAVAGQVAPAHGLCLWEVGYPAS